MHKATLEWKTKNKSVVQDSSDKYLSLTEQADGRLAGATERHTVHTPVSAILHNGMNYKGEAC